MKKMLRIVTTDLQKYNIQHFVIGGAVLGYARNKRLIPYDNDLDIMIDGEFWNTTLFSKIQEKWKSVDGFSIKLKDQGDKLWVLYSSTNGNLIDLWPWYVMGDLVRYYKWAKPEWDIPMKFIFPLKSINISGVHTYGPGDPVGYCEWQYGENWRTEITCKEKKDTKCAV